MNKFSIKIDLSAFFEDERKMVLIMVDPKNWDNVEALQNRVQTLFEVDSVRFTTADGCFIPSQEPIEIVASCKQLKAFIPKESFDKRKKKKSKKEKTRELHFEEEENTLKNVTEENDVSDETQKKRKYRSLEGDFASSTPNTCKRIKNYTGLHETLKQISKSSEISSTSEQPIPPPNYVPTVLPSSANKEGRRTGSIVSSAKDNNSREESQNSVGKSKRKQQTSKLENSIEISTTESAHLTGVPSSTFINNNDKSKLIRSKNNCFKNPSLNMNHIYFNESGDISTTTKNTQTKHNDQPSTKVIFQSPLNETDTKVPRIFSIRRSDMAVEKIQNKPVIEIQENIILKPVVVSNNLNDLQKPEATSTNTNNESANASASTGNLEKTMNGNNTTMEEPKYESSVDEGNSSLNDTNHSAACTAINKSIEDSQLLDNNDKEIVTGVGYDNKDDSMNQSANKEDASLDVVKDEHESSIVDCVDLSVDLDDEDDSKYKKLPSSKNLEDISISDTSDIEEISEVIDLNESEEPNNDSFSSSTLNKSLNDFKISRIISSCKEAKELPSVDDIMIFKIPFTNSRGNPDCTKFLAGKIERIQQRTKSMKLLILDGHSELYYVPAKYLERYTDDSRCEQKYVQIKFHDMIQPRVLPKNK